MEIVILGGLNMGLNNFNNPEKTLEAVEYKEPREWNPNEINILDDEESKEFGTWKKVKDKMLKLCESGDLTFISHKEDSIIGKPERMFEIKKNFVLITKTEKEKQGETKNKYLFLDDHINRRDDGYDIDSLEFHFWTYKIVENAIEYTVLSEKELDPQQHLLRGMKIKVKDLSEVTKTLKVKTLSNLFLCVENEPSIKPMPKDELIDFVKNLEITKEEFIEFLHTHPDGNIYNHTENFSKVRVYQELSGKWDDYPLHLMVWGVAGTGKTKEAECLNHKFDEVKGILEAGNGTIKGMIPSFAEKPSKVGYIIECLRRAILDELNKLIQNTNNYENFTDCFGKLNMLFEHKDRAVNSGNGNNIKVKATAKITLFTNAFGTKAYIYDHSQLMGQSTLSRVLHLGLGQDEFEFIQNNRLKKATQTKINNNQFLSIYDSCQNFLVDYDEEQIRVIVKQSIEDCKNFKTIWKPRALHHTILLLDGIVKFRCLFEGDKSFKTKPEDYFDLKNILKYLCESWLINVKNE